MTTGASDTVGRGVPLAFGALGLALAGPAVAALASELTRRSGALATVVTPPAALAMISVFAFHVRFALGAIESERRAAVLLASLAIVIGVIGFFAGLASMLGVPTAGGGFVPLPG